MSHYSSLIPRLALGGAWNEVNTIPRSGLQVLHDGEWVV